MFPCGDKTDLQAAVREATSFARVSRHHNCSRACALQRRAHYTKRSVHVRCIACSLRSQLDALDSDSVITACADFIRAHIGAPPSASSYAVTRYTTPEPRFNCHLSRDIRAPSDRPGGWLSIQSLCVPRLYIGRQRSGLRVRGGVPSTSPARCRSLRGAGRGRAPRRSPR